jgi:hypothetical protein
MLKPNNLDMHTHSVRALLSSNRRDGAVSVLFAASTVSMLMIVGLAVDYSFYTTAERQLNSAADAAALHAVRVAVEAIQQNKTNYVTLGQTAGQEWFVAQAGNVAQAKLINTPSVSVSFNSSNNLLTAQVNYTGLIATHFGGVFPATWTNWPNWGIAGGATAVQSTESYVQFDFLLDNSSSMLIAADPSGIVSMGNMTPCSTQAAGSGQYLDNTYSWVYNTTGLYGGGNNSSTQAACPAKGTTAPYVPYGFGNWTYTASVGGGGKCTNLTGGTAEANELVPPTNMQQGACDSRFTGPSGSSVPASVNQCPYLPQTLNLKVTTTLTGSYAQCVNNLGALSGGITTTAYSVSPTPSPLPSGKTYASYAITNANTPAAPCAFACHWTSTLVSGTNYSNDYYGLARQNNITLRFDVVQSAAETVVQDLINYLPNSPVAAPFSVGVYTFNTSLGTLYAPPATPATTASSEQTELNAALAAITNYSTPVIPTSANNGDTDFPDSMASMATILGTSGSGATPSTPRKNLFLVTDGVVDYVDSSGNRTEGPIDTTECTAIKNQGVTIYVLYTDYYPLPNDYYLDNIKQYTEPYASSQVYNALLSCASAPSTFFEASDSSSINTAMQQMLKIALTSPGRLAQ